MEPPTKRGRADAVAAPTPARVRMEWRAAFADHAAIDCTDGLALIRTGADLPSDLVADVQWQRLPCRRGQTRGEAFFSHTLRGHAYPPVGMHPRQTPEGPLAAMWARLPRAHAFNALDAHEYRSDDLHGEWTVGAIDNMARVLVHAGAERRLAIQLREGRHTDVVTIHVPVEHGTSVVLLPGFFSKFRYRLLGLRRSGSPCPPHVCLTFHGM